MKKGNNMEQKTDVTKEIEKLLQQTLAIQELRKGYVLRKHEVEILDQVRSVIFEMTKFN